MSDVKEDAAKRMIADWEEMAGLKFDLQFADLRQLGSDKYNMIRKTFIIGYMVAKREATFGVDWKDYNGTIN